MIKRLTKLSLILFSIQFLFTGLFAQGEQKAELIVQTGHTSYVSTVAFSPDGTMLASGSRDETIKLWNVASGQELRTLSGHTSDVYSVAFSSDGTMLASGSRDETIKLWDVASGQEIRTLKGHTSYVNSVAFSSDGTMLASGSWDKTIKLWDVAKGQEIRTLKGRASDVYSVAFSPDGKTVASGSVDKTIKLWDVSSGKEIRTLKGYTDFFNPVASPDWKMIASGSEDGTVKLWNVASGQGIRTLSGHTSDVYSVAFSPDGKTLASGSEDKTVKLWNIASGQEIRTLKGHASFVSAVFSPDGKTLASGSSYGTVKLWNVASGQELSTLSGQNSAILSVVFSPDGKTLASGSLGGTVKLWDLANGREVRTLKRHTQTVWSVAFSSDGKTLASGSEDRTVKLWDVSSGQILKSFPQYDPQTVKSVSTVVPAFYNSQNNRIDPISPDGRFQKKGGENSRENFHDAKSGKLLVSLIAFNKNDWVIVSPDGLFDASPGAKKLMHYVIGLEPIGLEQMKGSYYVPGLLQKIFKGEPLPKVELFSKKDLFPLVEFEQPTADQKNLDVKLKNRGGGIGQVQVLVNGKEFIRDARPVGFDSKQVLANLKISLADAPFIAGEKNRVEIVTRNSFDVTDKSISSRGSSRGAEIFQVFDYGTKSEPPNVYAIIGGISDYTGDGLDLSYAAKDAEDFAKAFELGASNLFGADKVHIRLLTSNDADAENVKFKAKDAKVSRATKEDFKQAFSDFQNATPNDIFIVYLAGHGVSFNFNANPNQIGGDTYLYLTQEATSTSREVLAEQKNAMAISSEELTDLMKQNKALKQVLILDTCAAGGAVEAINSLVAKRNLLNEDAQIRAIDRLNDRTGFFVLMGSAANKVSYEASEYGQGLLTYSLLEGMKGSKLREDQFADVSLLFNYAQDRVPDLAKNIGGIQRPLVIAPDFSRISTDATPEISGSFDIGKFTKLEQQMISLSSKKPLILRPRLTNQTEGFDDLELELMLRKALRDASVAITRDGNRTTQTNSFVFVEADEMVDALKPSGLYTVRGEDIELTLRLIRNRQPVQTIKIVGKVSEKEKFIKKIIEAIGQVKN